MSKKNKKLTILEKIASTFVGYEKKLLIFLGVPLIFLYIFDLGRGNYYAIVFSALVTGLVVTILSFFWGFYVVFQREIIIERLKQKNRMYGLWLFFPLLILFSLVGVPYGTWLTFNSFRALIATPVNEGLVFDYYSRSASRYSYENEITFKKIDSELQETEKLRLKISDGLASEVQEDLEVGQLYLVEYVPFIHKVLSIKQLQ